MLIQYDPEGDTLHVKLDVRAHLGHSQQLDFFRSLEYDDGELISVFFIAASKGINLEGVPRAEEIAEAIRAFRGATTQFEPVNAGGQR